MSGYVDSHCHLYFDRFDDDREEVIARTKEAGFTQVVNVGTDATTSRLALDLALAHPGFCYASAGLHPTDTNLTPAELTSVLAELEQMVQEHPAEFRAVGEIGLDYYWDRATPEQQKEAFVRQLDLAERLERPVIIHCRDALEDTLEIVESFADRVHGVFHCFGGNAEHARRVLELGWLVSFAGNVTFPKAEELREAARACTPDRLLLETDAPFLAPQAVRGKRCEPAFSLHTGDFLAELYQVDPETLRQQTAENARKFFSIPA